MNDTPETTQEVTLEGACPVCEGALQVRVTPGRVWTYCDACKRLSQPTVRRAANGSMMLGPAAAA